METWFKILNFVVRVILGFHIEIVIPVAPYVLVCNIYVCHTGLVPTHGDILVSHVGTCHTAL
jgi:hypothetical protein